MKAKLPFGKKKGSDEEEFEETDESTNPSHDTDATDSTDVSEFDEDVEGDENKSLIHKLKSKLSGLSKKKDAEAEDEEGEEDEEALKKKKRSKIIQYVIGGGLVVFLASDYIFPPEEPVAEPQLKPRPRPQKPATPATTETPAETPVETPSETPVETPSETPSETPTETPTETPVETPTETPSEPSMDTPVEEPVDDSGSMPTTEPGTESNTQIDIDPTADQPISSGSEDDSASYDTGAVDSGDSVDGNFPTNDDNLTDQILEDLEKQARNTEKPVTKTEYVAPPDYEYRGRGLVYNCTGKHWACVDAPSYKTCEDNAAGNKFLNKPVECYPFNVYETAKGCESMQNRMVSSSAKTNFCSE